MKVTIISVGGKNDKNLHDAISLYENRLLRGYDISWKLLPHSSTENETARKKESDSILESIGKNDSVWLLDETGLNVSSPDLAKKLDAQKSSTKNLSIIIGGAYGVDARVHERADFVWSLSKLVFPHQIVRLILIEQLYRADSINRGSGYHHS